MAIDVERSDGTAVVVVNRPEALNALDVEHLRALRDRLAELADDARPERSPAAEGAAEAVRAAWRSFEFNVQPGLALEALFVRLRRELALGPLAPVG